MKTEWGEVLIRRGGPIKEQMVPGVLVGRGLAVTQFPLTDLTGETAYGLTLANHGMLLPTPCVFFSWRLAVRCAEELIRVVSFARAYEPEVRERVSPKWDALLKPICEKYTHLDDLWEARRASRAMGIGNTIEAADMRRTWDAWARRN